MRQLHYIPSQVSQKIGLDEQGSPPGTRIETEYICPLETQSSFTGRAQRAQFASVKNVSCKRRSKKNTGPTLDNVSNLINKDEEKCRRM